MNDILDGKNTELQQLRIHELRDLARKMGVNAPTSKKKEVLIDEIIKIMNGESEPFVGQTKKGRPVRNNSDNFDVVDFIMPNQNEMKTFNEYSPYQEEESKFSFMVNMDSTVKYGDFDLRETFDREGIVELKPEGFGVLHVDGYTYSSKDVYINKVVIKQYDLRTGQKVVAECRKIKENYPDVAVSIKHMDKCGDYYFDDLELKPLSQPMNISATDITEFRLGGRYFVHPSGDSYETTANIASEIMSKYPNLKVETLFLNAMLERIPFNKKLITTYIDFSKQDEDVILGTKLYFERLKRIAETGENVVVVINEITQFAKSYNNIYLKSSSFNELSNVTVHRTKALLSCAKNTEHGSITIIAVDKLRVPQNIENLFKFEILPLFNN